MGLSNGKCHFCGHHTETLDHLFFHCVKIQEFLKKVFTYMYHIIPGSHNFEFHIYNVMLGFDIDNDITCLCNLLLFTAKWVIWKERNLIKYQQKVNSVIKLFNMFKCILIDNLKYSVKCERLMSKKDKLELLISNIEKWIVSIEFMVLSERKIGVAQPLVIYEMYGLIVHITSLHILHVSLYGCII